MDNKICLKVNTDLNASSEILSWFEQINQTSNIDQEIWWQCQTLLIEGFANIVEHAHKNLPQETPIEIEVWLSNKQIDIRILSQGEAFDLEKQLQQVPEFENNHRERGRGLKIMSAIADKLTYEPTADNRYCLLISKFY
ncbi:anti-sigma regulatory factor [Nostoc sp. FACHB-87]|uniref:ATP-binding protein n=1 Tax=Nostocales TaxID=1161 RepID=UPI0016868ACC|nr:MULTISPECIES: ATP-binding protein [Nostocales]MBD2299228.1 anti-sigma regulatory factor [Nostoc sp. FACHB-190]MBD2456042.1 anti-sigma regulatory factor [Nostoc sp. FACHB-87]MBD2476534.1 anti-sigma regulatory factor [Anabaena sp. FACHB-83]MBD2486531.1 anti-sigma regulatory factor [Aulosira sp. FACHB-615]